MSIQQRDQSRLEKIVEHCDDILQTFSSTEMDEAVFLENKLYQKAIAFDIMQIGELVAALSDDFKRNHKAVPWQQIKGVRNRIVHQYGEVNQNVLWKIAAEDIPELKEYCVKALGNIEL